jgi:glycosyltransferase involved in cell wall biosynthesis
MADLFVHQFVPTLISNDAVGNHTLRMHRALCNAGIDAMVWAVNIHPEASGAARLFSDFDRWRSRSGSRDVLVYQAASHSEGIVPALLRRSGTKVINYHNITPASYYERFDVITADSLRRADREVRMLASQARVAIAVSEYNATLLRKMGVRHVHVIPPYLSPALTAQPDPATQTALEGGLPGMRLLFVGRVVPNKGHIDLIRTLAVIRAAIDPHARLYLVGPPGPRLYMHALAELAARIVPGGVIFTGAVSDSQLITFYRSADVFLCMSEHEGFGIPLVEAMRAGLPVIAYDAAAVGETLHGAGVLVRTRAPAVVAEIVARVVADRPLRDELRRRQLDRAADLESFPRDRKSVEAILGADN